MKEATNCSSVDLETQTQTDNLHYVGHGLYKTIKYMCCFTQRLHTAHVKYMSPSYAKTLYCRAKSQQ